MMRAEEKALVAGVLLMSCPVALWLVAISATEPPLSRPKIHALQALLMQTPDKPALWGSAALGLVLGALLVAALLHLSRSSFAGAPFRRHFRGVRVVSAAGLKMKSRESAQQVSIAGIPMPTQIENLHLLVTGSTGSGKSVLIRELVDSAIARGDRIAVVDPNGDLWAKFGQPGDQVLNPYDRRTQGWAFFNEIRNDYDFKRYALSIVPRGQTSEEEEWAGYARLLLSETAKKLVYMGEPTTSELFRWTTIVPPDDLKLFLTGTLAESLFVGADKALASARFVLSNKLPEHISMPDGEFSIRKWLEDPKGGNLFITWREDMAEALKPLISAWADVLCTSVLSMPESATRRLWFVIDELASLEKIASIEAALTKGRKHGLRVVAGLQSTAQLDKIYGRHEAQTLRSCFRSLVVLGGARTDPQTCDDMSKALGEHEVERDQRSYDRSFQGHRVSVRPERVRERIVLPTEIAGLPDLTGYIGFAGDRPVARVTLEHYEYRNINEPFVER